MSEKPTECELSSKPNKLCNTWVKVENWVPSQLLKNIFKCTHRFRILRHLWAHRFRTNNNTCCAGHVFSFTVQRVIHLFSLWWLISRNAFANTDFDWTTVIHFFHIFPNWTLTTNFTPPNNSFEVQILQLEQGFLTFFLQFPTF